jgi:hypothetical protein
MTLDPALIGIAVTVVIAGSAFGLYIIRGEIKRNSVVTDATHAQTVPNHGASLRDAVDRIEKRIDGVHEDVIYLRNRVDRHVDDHDHGKV